MTLPLVTVVMLISKLLLKDNQRAFADYDAVILYLFVFVQLLATFLLVQY